MLTPFQIERSLILLALIDVFLGHWDLLRTLNNPDSVIELGHGKTDVLLLFLGLLVPVLVVAAWLE